MTNVDQIKNQARGVIMDQIDRRTTDVGNTVGEHVTNLRSMSDNLRDQGQTATANLVRLAADRLDGLSNYLTQNDGDRIVSDLESAARKQPMVTAAVGFMGGLLAARLLKASATERYRSASTTTGTTSSYGRMYDSSVDYDDTSGLGSALSEENSGEFVR